MKKTLKERFILEKKAIKLKFKKFSIYAKIIAVNILYFLRFKKVARRIAMTIPVVAPKLGYTPVTMTPNFNRKYPRNYPQTVAEILKDDIKFKPELITALEKYKAANPWKGDVWERRDKVYALFQELSKIYGIACPQLQILPRPNDPNACYIPYMHTIMLNGNMNVLTSLHEFGHALGKDERQTCTWSINLFRKVFPKAYAKLEPGDPKVGMGHMLMKKRTPAKDPIFTA